MNFLAIIYLLIVAIAITLVFSLLLRLRGPWGSIWATFIIILFAVIAASFWVEPAGPLYRDIYYMPPLVVGILVALLLAAATPSPRTRSKLDRTEREKEKEEADFYSVGIFFWILFAVMLVVLGIGYFSVTA